MGTVRSIPPASSIRVRLARPEELPTLWAFDRRASGCDRDRHLVLAALAELGCVYAHESEDGIDGFAIHSQAGSILHVGPVIAPTDEIACALAHPALEIGVEVCVHMPRPLDTPLPRMLKDAGVTVLPDLAKRMTHMVRGAPAAEVPGATCYALAGAAMG